MTGEGPTRTAVFSAIADPRRRRIMELLAGDEERDVGDLVRTLRLPQPAVSKHLGVLRRARLVAASRRGRRRIYRLNAGPLKPVHDWIKTYERFWIHQFDRIKERAERQARQQPPHSGKPNQEN